MMIERMRKRLSADRASFIAPCLPSSADKPPSGSNWIHEIKHDGYRLMARRDHVSDMTIAGQGHGYQGELYWEKAEVCRRRAELVRNDLSETSRWRKLAEQWLKMADEAEQGRNAPTPPWRRRSTRC
jgi:hypothetical protein